MKEWSIGVKSNREASSIKCKMSSAAGLSSNMRMWNEILDQMGFKYGIKHWIFASGKNGVITDLKKSNFRGAVEAKSD